MANKSIKKDFKPEFLEAFARIGTIVGACRLIGINRDTILEWKRTDPIFKENYDECERVLTERIEGILIEKALNGDLGSCIFLLKARSPHKYVERYQHTLDNAQFEKLIAMFTGIVKRTIPQELWPRVSAELETVAVALETNRDSYSKQ